MASKAEYMNYFSIGPIRSKEQWAEIRQYLEKKSFIFYSTFHIRSYPHYIFIGRVSFIACKAPNRKTFTPGKLLSKKIIPRYKPTTRGKISSGQSN